MYKPILTTFIPLKGEVERAKRVMKEHCRQA